MTDLLKAYCNHGSFTFKIGEKLIKVCNAPKTTGGVYLVYSVLISAETLIYVGSSGWVDTNGSYLIRKDGLFDRIVCGKQFDKPRKISWPLKMADDKIDKIIVKWYATFNESIMHIPAYVEAVCIQNYFNSNRRLPIWNANF